VCVPVVVVVGLFNDGKTNEAIVTLVILVAAVVAVRLFIAPMAYTLEKDTLIIHLGIINWRIPYADIDEIYPTRNPMSGAGFSLDRLHIAYRKPKGGTAWVLISPVKKEAFLKELAGLADGLDLEGTRIVRRKLPE
jgi:hypothetical protein